jgi:hypothetical protein
VMRPDDSIQNVATSGIRSGWRRKINWMRNKNLYILIAKNATAQRPVDVGKCDRLLLRVVSEQV